MAMAISISQNLLSEFADERESSGSSMGCRGIGSVEIHWQCSRAGSGVERVSVGKEAIEQLTLF